MLNLKAAIAWHKRKRRIGVQTRFLLGLAMIFFGFCLVVTTLFYLYEKKTLEENAYHKTEAIMATVESTRNYIRDILRPRMYKLYGKNTFILEAMSASYVSRVVMDIFQKNMPDFEYRRVAVNAFNPDFEANKLELEMIRYFKKNKTIHSWSGIIEKGSKRIYTQFRPVVFHNSCLHCHGKPADAPSSVVSLYGHSRGFNQTLNEVGGVASVGVPIDVGTVAIMEVAWKVFSVTLCAFFLLYGIIWLFFNNLITRDLHGILEVFRDTLRDEDGVQLYEQARTMDEFGELSLAVQRVAEHLRRNQQTREDYTQNLEQKVRKRTLALEDSKRILHEQFQARGQQLGILNTIAELITQSTSLEKILPKIMELALKVIPAAGAGIYLLDRKKSLLVLQCQANAENLETEITFDANRLDMLDRKQMDFDGFIREAICEYYGAIAQEPLLAQNFNVPLCCRQHVLGVISFVGNREDGMDIQMQELIFSIAHQIGITIESMQNITALIHNKELLQTVFDGITDIVILLDNKRRIKMVNRAFLERHGVTMSAVLDQPLSALQLVRPCPFSFCNMDAPFSHRQPISEQIQLDGLSYEVSFYPIFVDDEKAGGEIRNIVCYAKDTTKQKEIERRIQQTEKLVALGQLAAGVAHEVNNPLGIILCYTDILKGSSGDDPNQRQEDILIIEKHARSCQRIVADLLHFSHSNKSILRETLLNPVLEEVIHIVTPQFTKKNIGLKLFLSPEIPAIKLDTGRIKQVFLNLIMNSLYAVEENGIIEVSSYLKPSRKEVAIEFFDNGRGIPPEIVNKIFDPFFTTKPQGTGTGLGLSVSYGIIQEHSGDIMVESKANIFTRFTLILPVPDSSEGDEQ